MQLRQLLLILLLCLPQFRAVSQNPGHIAKGNQWLTNWLICGPIPIAEHSDVAKRGWYHSPGYETDYLKKWGGEGNLKVKAGDVVTHQTGKAIWKAHIGTDSIIDLRQYVSKEAPVLAYALTEIIADKDQTMALAFGTNDGGTLWVNGVKVWDVGIQRSLQVDGEWLPIALKKGKNQLLFKIEQLGNKWEFCARLQSFTPSEFAQKEHILRIDALPNGTAKLTSAYSTAILQQLIQKASVKVENALGQVVWQQENIRQYHVPVILPNTTMHSYKVHYDIALTSGEQLHWHQTLKAGLPKEYTLFDNGKTSYVIALDTMASASEQWAAQELQHWLKAVSGAHFPIVTLNKSQSPRFIIGHNSYVEKRTNTATPALLDERYYYSNFGDDILIYGGKQRGTMYGVLSFLENEMGVRWYSPRVSVTPQKKQYTFTSIGHSEAPGIRVRNDFYYEAFDPTWAARNKVNGAMELRMQPGGLEGYWAVHTFYPLVPPSEFFATHPEYYSLIDGKRVAEKAQLCLSNPEVLAIVKERIKKKMREAPDYLIYDVSQNDHFNPCQCDQCQHIVKREGSESGLMIWFVNQVAEAVEKEFPDKFIGTLAYQYTRSAPTSNIKPRDNVVVRFCSIECCFAHDFTSCPKNKSFMDDLTAWSKRAPHLYIWDYVVNFNHYVMPFPNFAVLQPNIKTFQQNNAIGIMEQAAYQSRGGEFSELRAYLIAKLLWNPDIDTDAVINDFMYGYYGRAGQYIRQYFDLSQQLVKPDTHFEIWMTPADKLFSDKFVDEALQIFEQAYKVADNDEITQRIDVAKLPILYLKCRRTPAKAKHDGTYAELVQIMEREGITHLAEAGAPNLEEFHNTMKQAQ